MSHKLPYINILQSVTVGPVQNDIALSFDLKILPDRETRALPFYGIWLLDTSYSMGGKKWKSAINSLEEQIRSLPEGTTFTLIGFGPTKVYFENRIIREDAKQVIIKKIHKLKPRGSTPMFEALGKAIKILKQYKGPLSTKKLILITDGYPDRGCSKNDPMDKQFLEFMRFAYSALEYKASIDTVGALKDHNVLLLYELAKRSTGKYIFADTAQELKEKMTIASGQATQVMYNNPSMVITPMGGTCVIKDAVQYKPTIIRMPFEHIGDRWKAWLRSMEAGDTYQILLKTVYHPQNSGSLTRGRKIPIFDFMFDFGGGLRDSREISITFSDNTGDFRINQNINRQYVNMYTAAEEISDATIKGDAARTQRIQGDETKKISN